jgi:hypothetical protein
VGSTGYGHGDLGREALNQVGLLFCDLYVIVLFGGTNLWAPSGFDLSREALDQVNLVDHVIVSL